eukprot:Nk52_evm20s367 gene=Nk52_evmTU20s367
MQKFRRQSTERIKLIGHTRIGSEDEISENYDFGEVLGKGAFGVVRKLTHKGTNTPYAMKMMDKSKAGSSAVKQLEREITILKTVKHEYIVSLLEIFETSKKMYIVMECCSGGELMEYVASQPDKRLDEAGARTVIARLSSAIAYLHDKDIVHRDLKLENILLSTSDPKDPLNIKVTDFGLSEIKGKDSMMQTMCGTPIYMAPEVIDNMGYSQQCDVWSIGIIMYYILSGYFPFTGTNEEELYSLILAAEIKFPKAPWSDISDSAKGLIGKMLLKDPAHRCTAKEISGHPWTAGKDGENNEPLPTVLEMMRAYNVEQKFIANVNLVIEQNRKKKREKFMAIYLGTDTVEEAKGEDSKTNDQEKSNEDIPSPNPPQSTKKTPQTTKKTSQAITKPLQTTKKMTLTSKKSDVSSLDQSGTGTKAPGSAKNSPMAKDKNAGSTKNSPIPKAKNIGSAKNSPIAQPKKSVSKVNGVGTNSPKMLSKNSKLTSDAPTSTTEAKQKFVVRDRMKSKNQLSAISLHPSKSKAAIT